jgi:hypothetical protein
MVRMKRRQEQHQPSSTQNEKKSFSLNSNTIPYGMMYVQHTPATYYIMHAREEKK